MKKPKEYEIESFEQLVNVVTDKNFESLTTDFVLWLGYTMHFLQEVRNEFPKQTKGKSNWDLAKCSFIWIDDGKHERRSVKIKNRLTGEIKTFELKPK